MNKSEFCNLKDINNQEAITDILSNLRNKGQGNELVQIVSYAYLALILKNINNEEFLTLYLDENIKDQTTNVYLKKCIFNESFDYIEEISNKYEEDILKAVVLFSEPTRFSESGINSTLEGISNLALSLLNITEEDKIIDMGSGVNSFLIQTGLTTASKSLKGIEINTQCVIIANIRSAVVGLPIEIIQGNILSQDFTELDANKVFSNLPLGMRWPQIEGDVKKNKNLYKYFKDAKRTISGDWAYALAALLTQKKPGKTIVLMANSGTWNKSDEEIRRSLIKTGQIEGIISLPSNLLSFTSVNLVMMIFSENNEKIRMVDASELFTEGRRVNALENDDIYKIINAYNQDSDISISISVEEIEKQEYILNPHRYVGLSTDIENGIALGEVCKSLNRGAMISSKELDELASVEETDYHYLMLQNLQDGVIESNLPYLREIEERYDRHCIRDNNLIISKLSPFKVALAHVPKDKKILANGNLYMIELDENKVNPIFVELFLQSEAGMIQLNRYAKGAAMKSISIQDLKNIKIPNVPRVEQDRVAEELEMLNDELTILQKQTEIIKDKKIRLIQEVI